MFPGSVSRSVSLSLLAWHHNVDEQSDEQKYGTFCLSDVRQKYNAVPDGSHATNNHYSTNDANALVFGHSAGELLTDDDVHIVLQRQTER